MSKLIFLISFFFSMSVLAQTQQDQFNAQIEEIMKAREEMLKSLMDNSMSGSFEKRMEEIMKRFGGMDDDFDISQFHQQLGGPVIGEYDWVETDTSRILKIKVKQIKDHPLDIKIQNGEIKFKGDVESSRGMGKNKTVSKVHFERSFGIPNDVDQNNPSFENSKDGSMMIAFKKLHSQKNVKSKQDQRPPAATERVPLTPDKNDLSI